MSQSVSSDGAAGGVSEAVLRVKPGREALRYWNGGGVTVGGDFADVCRARLEGDAMDRIGAARRMDSRQSAAGPLVLPSRAVAIERIRKALEAGESPILLTGEVGTGKSWVAGQVVEALPIGWTWATVQLSPAIGPVDLHGLVLRAFGLAQSGGGEPARLRLMDALEDAFAQGRRWGLVVDDAQNGSDPVIEELRVLGDRIGGPGTLAGMILIGQTALARRLKGRTLSGLDARISTRVTLKCLDLNEFRILIRSTDVSPSWSAQETEWVHRQAEGNPLRVLRLARAQLEAPAVERLAETLATSQAQDNGVAEPTWTPLPVAAARPPIEVGEGMIEVGWDDIPETEFESEVPAETRFESEGTVENAVGGPPVAAIEPIHDRFAALQAWTEWSQGQGRETVKPSGVEQASEPESHAGDDGGPAAPSPNVWAEGQHGFAPYSQLFTRLRQQRDPQ